MRVTVLALGILLALGPAAALADCGSAHDAPAPAGPAPGAPRPDCSGPACRPGPTA